MHFITQYSTWLDSKTLLCTGVCTTYHKLKLEPGSEASKYLCPGAGGDGSVSEDGKLSAELSAELSSA